MHTIGEATTAVMAAVFAIAITSFSSLAASDFEGVWKVRDTAVEHGLDHEDRERGRSIKENCLRQRPAAGRSTDQRNGRAKGKVTALRLPHSIQGIALSVNSKVRSDRGRTL